MNMVIIKLLSGYVLDKSTIEKVGFSQQHEQGGLVACGE